MNKEKSHCINLNSCAVEKTLLKLNENRRFILNKEFKVLSLKHKDWWKFKIWDEVVIDNIIIKGNNETIKVNFTHYRNSNEVEKMEMSWAIFLSYFLSSIDLENIVLNDVTEEVKDKVEKLVDDIDHLKKKQIKKEEEKWWFKLLKLFKKKKSKD